MIASDVMTLKPRTIRANASIRTALDILWSNDVRHLPVVDEDDGLVGMLSDRDLGTLVKSFDGTVEALGPRRVSDFMSSDVISVDVDTELVEVIETLLEHRIGAVPVVDGEGALAGIISYVDLLRTYVSDLGPATTPGHAAAANKTRAKKPRAAAANKRRAKKPRAAVAKAKARPTPGKARAKSR